MSIQPVSFRLHAGDPDRFARDLGASFERYGFAVIDGHPIAAREIADALADARAFFALPVEEKLRHRPPNGRGQRGYTPFGVETAKGAEHFDLKEFWHVGRDLPAGHRFEDHMPANVWPDAEVPGFRRHLSALYAGLDDMGAHVLAAVARHLKLPDDWFAGPVEHGNSILRLLHYPPTDGTGEGVRAAAHEDINVITLLLGAEEGGLQLLDKDTGEWLAVNPPAGSIVVNIGDMLQRLTNGVLPSTSHRVVNPAPERRGVARYSTPFFLHFASDFCIKALPSTIGPGRPAPLAPITAHDFLQERLREIRLA